ncbi:MAG: antibiotic biosynthesis monooxygenase [Gemmatimonadota bacterium]|jgi:antibiotic biosynthesis monooxygenase (ABM) superfamily enzyme
MIARVWRGWTTPENADQYEELLRSIIILRIESLQVPGYRGIEVLRRQEDEEVAFVTVMRFKSLESVKEFAGDDYKQAWIPSEAKRLLKRYDEHARHYEIVQATRFE